MYELLSEEFVVQYTVRKHEGKQNIDLSLEETRSDFFEDR